MFWMSIAIAACAFALMFVLQIFIARLYRPVSEDKFIIVLYVLLPMAVFLCLAAFHFFGLTDTTTAVLSYLLFFVLSSGWVASYPAIYAICPTLVITYVIHFKGEGITAEYLRELLGLKQNSTARLEDAIHDKWVRKNGNDIELTGIGRMFYTFFAVYRTVIGLKLDTL